MSKLEIAAFILNVLGVWLTSKQYRICWIINIVAVALYVVIFYEVKLYSDAMLQGVFILLQLYGWYSWSTQKAGIYSVSNIIKPTIYKSVLVGILAGTVLGFVTSSYTDAALPWLDAYLTAFSLVASLWAARKYIESWLMWCVLDLIYSFMYLHKGLYLTALLYFIFILLAINGWFIWHRMMLKAQQLKAAQSES